MKLRKLTLEENEDEGEKEHTLQKGKATKLMTCNSSVQMHGQLQRQE